MFESLIALLLAFSGGAQALAQSAPEQPCPEIVQVGNRVTLVCDDGEASFDLTKLEAREAYYSPVMAGSHTIHQLMLVGDEVRIWYDKDDQGEERSRVTILNLDSGELILFGP